MKQLLPDVGLYGIHGFLITVSYFTNLKLSRPLRHSILGYKKGANLANA